LNPFASPSSTRALCPWELPDDLDYYVEVDNYPKCLGRLQDELAYADPAEGGYAILVHGKSGCGKTAFANRAAYLLNEKFRVRFPNISVINLLGDETQLGVPIDSKVRTHCQLVSDALYRDKHIAEPEYKLLRERIEERALFTNTLDQLIKGGTTLLILLFPPIELEGELDAYVNLWRRRNVMGILSTSSPDVVSRTSSIYGPSSAKPVLRLEVGPLRAEDGWTFVEKRLDQAFKMGLQGFPGTTRGALEQYMKERMEGSEISIRELHRTCDAVFDHVGRGGRTEVEFTDFALYWTRFGR
jgi:hypothetical protein